MSIVVVAHIHAREGKEAETEAALSALVLASQGEEGCLFYALHRGTENPREFTTVEKWSGPEALGAHFGTPHIAAVLSRADELLERAPDIRNYEALPLGGEQGAL
ncbi:putative quinol monooxygenase [Patulibacter sp. NPDC049589]|uniref:putative quinol monooxygenase n=1 Tax=Patulibacter sp. NPDC049589 TaxID=3154731 RepID=UPI003430F0EB